MSDLEKWIPIIMTVIGMIGGGWGLFIKAKEQQLKKQSVDADAQAAILEFAKDYKTENTMLKERITVLEDEVARIPALEAAIQSLKTQLELVLGGSAYALEGDYESFRG